MYLKIVKLFLKLVQINSESGYEQGMVSFITEWLKQRQISYKQDQNGNIVGYVKGAGEPLILSAHMDTVSPGNNIQPIVNEKGVIKAKGKTILGADNKAALAAILTIVDRHLKQKNPKALELLFTVKEEIGDGLSTFPFSWLKGKTVFLFDCAEPLGGIVLRSPFIINFQIIFQGQASHASNPNQAKNAFAPLSELFNQIKVGYLNSQETTINLGQIQGGQAVNIVPELVTIKGEVRSYKKALFINQLHKIKKIALKLGQKHVLKVDWQTSGYCPGYTHTKSDPTIQNITKLFKKNKLLVKYYNYSGVSDANIFNNKGLKAINMTDGVKYPHTNKEQIKIKDLIKLSEIVFNCINQL